MATRMQSPRYPSCGLGEAVEYVEKLHRADRQNSIHRAAAVETLGYSGLSGRSMKVLSNLTQFGLLEKSSSGEIRVSDLAVEIILPDSEESRKRALEAAAETPELFKRIRDRFEGRPSEGALRNWLMKEGFTNVAIPPALRAYLETEDYLEKFGVTESHGAGHREPVESQSAQPVKEARDLQTHQATRTAPRTAHPLEAPNPAGESGPEFRYSGRKIFLGGVVATKEEAQEVIDFINALMPALKEAPAKAAPVKDSEEDIEEFEAPSNDHGGAD